MSPDTPAARNLSRGYLRLSRTTARALSLLTPAALLGWFVAKFFLTPDAAGPQVAVGLLAFIGMGGVIVLFLSLYSFQAHAPDKAIDEREVAERNRAYFKAYQAMWLALFVGWCALELGGSRVDALFSREVATNFLSAVMFAGLVLPACLLAWWDPGEDG